MNGLRLTKLVIWGILITLLLVGCGTPTASPPSPNISTDKPTLAPPTTEPKAAIKPAFTPTSLAPTQTPIPKGQAITVTSTSDSGPGTLRQALLEAQSDDTINFDPSVFPPAAPETIFVNSELPPISQGNLTIDASEAGVILDGRNITGEFVPGLQVMSNENKIQGLQIVNFSGAGIVLSGGAQNNLIGGDRSIGNGPIGQGNLTSGNEIGIGLWDEKVSYNSIKGNLIGTNIDATTMQGNHSTGVYVSEGASHNTIGPSNIIAYNANAGIQIYQSTSIGNRITQNSIHDNGAGGIQLVDGGNGTLAAPILMDFDLTTGSLNGVACPDCEVMVYSDLGNEGNWYEGSSIADNDGVFSLEVGSPFTGPGLTATATDAKGNTSGFSNPTIGNSRSMLLQTGNIGPRPPLLTKPSDELADNRLGAIWSDFWQPFDFQGVIDTEIVPDGLKFVKITMNQAEFSTSEQSGVELFWDKPELFISDKFDSYINQLVSHKVAIDYMLNFWDKANHPDGWEVQYRFKTEEDITHYLEYVRFIVTQFKGRVQYYELWNEPDVWFPLQYIEPADFINLAKRTIPVIKEIDPLAKTVIPCVSGTAHQEAQDYLFEILNSDLMPIVDVISWHPLFGNVPNGGEFPDYYATYPYLLENIIDTAKQNGFKGEFMAGEISYGGPTCGGCDVDDPAYSEIVWAKYSARGIILHFGNDVAVSVGSHSTVFNTVRYIANVFAGVHADEFEIDLQTESKNIKAFTFTGMDGSRLIALWTDGAAVDDDPGIPSTITIPGRSGWNATGIDVLYGFEQELISKDENGNLVIHDLMIKDYPIIIRLSE